jgi:hypothetical protein
MKREKQDRNRRGQFLPGVSGNPGGRPVGSPSIALDRLNGPREKVEPEDWVITIERMLAPIPLPRSA